MALDIQTFQTWAKAQADLSTVAGLDKGPDQALGDYTQKVGFFARFFGTRHARDVRQDAVRSFQHALTDKFGASIARVTIANIQFRGLLAGGLTAHSINQAINTAKLYAARTMLTPRGFSLKLTDANLNIPTQVFNGMNPQGRSTIRTFRNFLGETAAVLGALPIGPQENAEWHQKLSAVRGKFDGLFDRLVQARAAGDLTSEMMQQMTHELDRLATRLTAKEAAVRDVNAAHPLDAAAKTRLGEVWKTVVALACSTVQMDFLEKGDEASAQAMAAVKNGFGTGTLLQTKFPNFGWVNKDFPTMAAKRVRADWAAAHPNVPFPRSEKDFIKLMKEAYHEVLNRGTWAPVSKTFEASVSGQSFKLTSDITPAKHIRTIGETYPAGVNGYMCHCAKESHAVNLAASKLTMVSGGEGKVVFSGVRHGVHCAWELTGTARAEANAARALETMKAAFLTYLENPTNLATANQNPGHVTFLMSSVSLLTPDCFRGQKGETASSNEKRMLLDQAAAWGAAAARPFTVRYNGTTYTVQPQVLQFNFGVNAFGTNALSDVAGGWGTSDLYNRASISVLDRQVGDFLRQPNLRLETRTAVETLHRQVKGILAEKGERSDSHDAYKAASRLAVLTHLIGGVPAWNCKSGKDRTGEMDAECKFLSTLIARNLPIPEPGAELTDEQKNLFRSIALQCGNHEMQEYNTGLAGYKTGGVDSIEERLGGARAKNFHKGGADYVGV